MKEEMNPERWRDVCEAIMKETDPDKLQLLVTQLNRALEDREAHTGITSLRGISNVS